MPAVSPEIISRYKNFWDGANTDALVSISYDKGGADAGEKGLLKPWMAGSAEWIFARAVIRAYETGDHSAVTEAFDVMEHELERTAYAGAGYPYANMNTGAGCVAAFITGYANFYNDTVWFELGEPWDYEKIISLPHDFTTPFAETQLAAVEAAAKRFGGGAVITPLDLGGLADVLSSLRRTDGFLYDMIDRPDDVKEALHVLRAIWKHFHDRMTAIIEPANDGLYTSWTRMLSDSLYYPSQCDACAMISPAMFDEFVWPTLSDEMSSYGRTLYHLDGSGEAPHLDTMCKNPSLKVIQWVPEPAAGHADAVYYPIYEKIIALGRKIIFDGFRGTRGELAALLKRFPCEAFCVFLEADGYDDAMRLMEALS